MYQFKEDLNQINRFLWDKQNIKNMSWANLPKSSKIIYPVIACHCNKQGVAFPGEQTIAILSGYSEKKVREGIRGLEKFPGFTVKRYVTNRGRWSKRFYLTLPSSDEKGRSFPFYKFIIESGFWSQLKPTAKALYPVMRYFAFFDLEPYNEAEGESYSPIDWLEVYKDREYDFCDAKIGVLAEYSGISRRSIREALDNLERNYLISYNDDEDNWKVYRMTKNLAYLPRDFLNKQILERYGMSGKKGLPDGKKGFQP